MSSRGEATLPATRPKSRKSMAHSPSADSMDKENMTADIGVLGGIEKRAALGERPSKKSRSKSIGPGGLDVLKDGRGNRRKVRLNRRMLGHSMLIWIVNCCSSAEVYTETYDTASARNSCACSRAKRKSEEDGAALPVTKQAGRLDYHSRATIGGLSICLWCPRPPKSILSRHTSGRGR